MGFNGLLSRMRALWFNLHSKIFELPEYDFPIQLLERKGLGLGSRVAPL